MEKSPRNIRKRVLGGRVKTEQGEENGAETMGSPLKPKESPGKKERSYVVR